MNQSEEEGRDGRCAQRPQRFETDRGQPCFAGTRIMVWQVLELLEAGIAPMQITSKKYFPHLTQDHIQAALHYAAEQLKHREFVAFAKS